MTYTSITPGPYGQNRYMYNGKEFQPEFGLDWLDYGARFYDPALGRFMTQDRFAEKYMDLTPYQYAANNPINAIDVNGDSIWYTRNDNVITMHFTAKIINASSDNINVKRAASDIASGINAAFSGEFKVGGQIYTLQTDIQLEAVSSMGDVSASDHLFNIVDADGEGARGAVNEIGGKVINVASVDYANDNWFSNTFSWNNTRSAVHEFGHAAGLTHESPSGWGNLMTQKGHGTNVTSEQRLTMVNAVSFINKGTNSYMGKPNPYLHGYNPVTRRWETTTVHRVFNPSYYRKR
jgi:RHS repeat-associated protein